MKYVHFIRHGETIDNIRNVPPADATPITSSGRNHVHKSLQELGPIECTKIWCGTTKRAIDTISIIKEQFPQARTSASSLLNERQNKPEEESQTVFLARTSSVLSLLETQEDDVSIVVSHAGVMKAIVALIESTSDNALQRYITIEQDYLVQSGGVLTCSFDTLWRIDNNKALYNRIASLQ